MTVDGNWSLVLATPLGERRGILSVKTEGATLKGQMVDANSTEIFDGTSKAIKSSKAICLRDA